MFETAAFFVLGLGVLSLGGALWFALRAMDSLERRLAPLERWAHGIDREVGKLTRAASSAKLDAVFNELSDAIDRYCPAESPADQRSDTHEPSGGENDG